MATKKKHFICISKKENLYDVVVCNSYGVVQTVTMSSLYMSFDDAVIAAMNSTV